MTKNVKQFAESYLGCQVVANLMGLNVETVRKRAKSGKIPATQVNKTWTFKHNELVTAGVDPFKNHGYIGKQHVQTNGIAALIQPKRKNVTQVIFVLDNSGSMQYLLPRAREALDAQLKVLYDAVTKTDEYYVSVVNFAGQVVRTLVGVPVSAGLSASTLYGHVNGGTRLNDAIGDACAVAKKLDDGTNSTLISILTDGEEIDSWQFSAHDVKRCMAELSSNNRTSFAFAGPTAGRKYANAIGIPDGNVTAWEQTQQGMVNLNHSSVASFTGYTTSRAMGQMTSKTFYAQPTIADADAFAKKLDGQLDEVTKLVTAKRVTDKSPFVINKFCQKEFGSFEKGKYFYQLSESEKVQSYKKVLIQDSATGAYYQGWDAAKKLLGIPDFNGTVRIKPGNLGAFKVFIQSTSTNRKLVAGTTVVYLP